jgi:hypothetical protein
MNTPTTPQLIFAGDATDQVRELQQAFDGCPALFSVTLKPEELPNLEGLDALYLTLVAAERWDPKLVFYKAQILDTRPEDEGWPPYIVAGIAMKPDDPRAGNPSAELELVTTAVLAALKTYNELNKSPIRKVAFWTDLLRINRMDAFVAGRIIRSAYEEQYPPKNT